MHEVREGARPHMAVPEGWPRQAVAEGCEVKRLKIVVDSSVPKEHRAEVRRIVAFAFDHHEPKHKARIEVHVKKATRAKGQWTHGRAYDHIPYRNVAPRGSGWVEWERVKVERGRTKFVELWVSFDSEYPKPERRDHRLKTGPLFEWRSWQESLAHVAAHEARHVWQYFAGRPCGELDAERFGVRKLHEWRRLHDAQRPELAEDGEDLLVRAS